MYINVIPDSILIAARLIYFYMLDEQYQEEQLFETMLAQTLNKIGVNNHSLSSQEDEAVHLGLSMMQQNAGDFGTGGAQKQSSPGSTLLALYTNTCAINWDYTPLLVGNKLPFKIITDCMSVIVGKLCRLSMTIIDSEIGLDIVKSVETYFQKTDFDKVMDDIFIIDLLLNQKDFEAAIEQGIL